MSHAADSLQPCRWYQGLHGYHWLVLVVAALGWSFDTMDQCLYVMVKTPANADLLQGGVRANVVSAGLGNGWVVLRNDWRPAGPH